MMAARRIRRMLDLRFSTEGSSPSSVSVSNSLLTVVLPAVVFVFVVASIDLARAPLMVGVRKLTPSLFSAEHR